MPKLNHLTCSLELTGNNVKLREFGTKYDDAQVNTYVPVPKEQMHFSIHLTSEGYIAPGLAMFVFIDGQYQCNRSRLDLPLPAEGVPPSSYQVDLRVRQKEEIQPSGEFIGREWCFHPLNLVSPDKADTVSKQFLNNLGKIEVLILRCKKSENPLHVRSSSLTDTALPKPTPANLLITRLVRKTTPKVTPKAPSAAQPKTPPSKAPSKAPLKAVSSKKPASSIGGFFGLFDGAADYNLDGVPYGYGQGLDPYARNQNYRGPEYGGDFRPDVRYEPDRARPAFAEPFSYEARNGGRPRIQELASGPTNTLERQAGQVPIIINNHYHGSAKPSRAPSQAPSQAPSLPPRNSMGMRASARHDLKEGLRRQGLTVSDPVLQHNRVRSEPYPPKAHAANADDLFRKLADVEARLNGLLADKDDAQDIPRRGRQRHRAVSAQRNKEPPYYDQYQQSRTGNVDPFKAFGNTWRRNEIKMEAAQSRDENAQHQRGNWSDGADLWANGKQSPQNLADDWEMGEMRYSDMLRQRQGNRNRHMKRPNGDVRGGPDPRSDQNEPGWGTPSQESVPGAWPGDKEPKSVEGLANMSWWKEAEARAAGRHDWNAQNKRGTPDHTGWTTPESQRRNPEPDGDNNVRDTATGSREAAWRRVSGGTRTSGAKKDSGWGNGQTRSKHGGSQVGWNTGSKSQSGNNIGWGDTGNKQPGDNESKAGDDRGNSGQADDKNNQERARTNVEKDNRSHHRSRSQQKNDNWANDTGNTGGNNWQPKHDNANQNDNSWGYDQQQASGNAAGGWGTIGNADNNANNDNANWGSNDDAGKNANTGWGADNKQPQDNNVNNSWGNDDNKANDSWGNDDQKPAYKPHSIKVRRPSRAAKSTAGETEATFQMKPYWSSWNKPPEPDPESPSARRNPFKYPAEPTPAISRTAVHHSVSSQVRIGPGADFFHETAKPQYIDSMDAPYAIFRFKYRSVEHLENKFGTRIEDDPQDLKAKVLTMTKQDLMDEYIRRKIRGEKTEESKKAASARSMPVGDKVGNWNDGNRGKAASVKAEDKKDDDWGNWGEAKSNKSNSYTYVTVLSKGDKNLKQGDGGLRNDGGRAKNTGWGDNGGQGDGWGSGAQNGAAQGSGGVAW